MATKPRTILTPGDSATPAQPVEASLPSATSVEPTSDEAEAQTEQDVMRQRVADTVFTFPDPQSSQERAPKAETPAAPAQPVVSNTPKLTPDGWVVPADFGAQPKRVG